LRKIDAQNEKQWRDRANDVELSISAQPEYFYDFRAINNHYEIRASFLNKCIKKRLSKLLELPTKIASKVEISIFLPGVTNSRSSRTAADTVAIRLLGQTATRSDRDCPTSDTANDRWKTPSAPRL
jgi:hypothetical protein